MPVLITRTPYGADMDVPDGSSFDFADFGGYYGDMAKEGYYFIFQDIRGKYKSEGNMEIHQPLTHAKATRTIDESTDTWDTVDWLKNLQNNNGKSGDIGHSVSRLACADWFC